MDATVIDINRLKASQRARKVADRERRTPQRLVFGRRLAALRQAAGLTQAQVAERCSISQSSLSTLEGGHGDLSRIKRAELAKVYGLTVEALVENPLEIVLKFMAARPDAPRIRATDLGEYRRNHSA